MCSAGGPGLGNIAPSQADYFQATKGGGHGDYHQIVLAPSSVQEMHDLTIRAFELADAYRTPVMILTDGRLGQMMEPLQPRDEPAAPPPPKPWALTGAAGRPPNTIRSLYLVEGELEQVNLRLQAKYRRIEAEECRWQELLTEDAELLLVAYGASARIAQGVVMAARKLGIRAGLMRPITLWPFPYDRLRALAGRLQSILVVEMSSGQMIEDVRLAVAERVPVFFEGRMGGAISSESDVLHAALNIMHASPPAESPNAV